jgi:hypothetical protein
MPKKAKPRGRKLVSELSSDDGEEPIAGTSGANVPNPRVPKDLGVRAFKRGRKRAHSPDTSDSDAASVGSVPSDEVLPPADDDGRPQVRGAELAGAPDLATLVNSQ